MSKEPKEQSLEELETSIARRYKELTDAENDGKRTGRRIAKKYAAPDHPMRKQKGGIQTDLASSVLAELMFHCYKVSEENECHELLKKWVEEKFWGKIVDEKIPDFEEIWQELRTRKHHKNNPFIYGDADAYVWIEKVKNKRIIVHQSQCSCAEDNTHIFIQELSGLGHRFHVRTVWPRQSKKGGYAVEKSKKHPDGWFSWGDDRDISVPSLNTYRERDFSFGYMDCRDKGYVLSTELFSHSKRIEWAGSFQSEIKHALWLINIMKRELKGEE